MRETRQIIGSTVVVCLASSVLNAAIIADSVADFSGSQGANGWQYGYVVPSDGLGFRLFPNFGQHSGSPAPGTEPAWFISYSGEPILFPTPYTHLTAQGGHTNGGTNAVAQEHWTVRRWTAPHTGTFDFSGLLGDYAPAFGGGGDGVFAEAVVGGTTVWSFSTTRTTAEFAYGFSTFLTAGSMIDFVVKPKLNEDTDYYVWTVQVVPAPASAFLFVGLASRRRRAAGGMTLALR